MLSEQLKATGRQAVKTKGRRKGPCKWGLLEMVKISASVVLGLENVCLGWFPEGF